MEMTRSLLKRAAPIRAATVKSCEEFIFGPRMLGLTRITSLFSIRVHLCSSVAITLFSRSHPPEPPPLAMNAPALDRSCVVEASAGTGKTPALVARIVEAIVAVTFTHAAAGTPRKRQSALTRSSPEAIPPEPPPWQ